MINVSRWALSALLTAGTLLCSACAGGSSPSLPFTANQGSSVFNTLGGGKGVTALGARTDITCPKQYTEGCYTFSLSKGLNIAWCYGTTKDTCKDTKESKWSGDVCLAKTKKCGPIEELTAKWTGPFKCKEKICKSKGYYELDTISKGKKPPKITSKYLYKQEITLCLGTSCAHYYIGLNVSK